MHSLFKFKTTVGATTVVWETCAPGHGKGPWGGIGAVVKRFVRLLEKHSKLYADGARDVFCALVDQILEGKSRIERGYSCICVPLHSISR